jgi:DNA-binding MarR family transcriptional regulator
MPDARECARLLLDSVPGLMRRVFEAVRQSKQDEDDPLTMGQIRMLDILGHGPRTLSELASLHHVTPSTMSRTVDVLVRRDWVSRQQAPSDRRQVVLTLTEGGQEALGASRQHMYDVATRLLERLDDDERARLYDGLSVLQRLVERTKEEQQPCTFPKRET